MTNYETSNLAPAIEMVPLDKLTIYHVTESELQALERGSTESLFLNLGISFVSIFISFLIALLSTKIDSIKIYCFFVIVAIACGIASLTFGLLWWHSRRSLKTVAKEIRARRIPKGIQEKATQE